MTQQQISREARRRVAQRERLARQIAREFPDDPAEDQAAYVEDAIKEEDYEAACDLAEMREINGYPEDTPCLQSCDDAGTGEGRFHGRM